jgi:hypothetical protein
MWNVPSALTSIRTQHARRLVALGAIAVGLMLLLVVPAMASAQAPAPAASPAVQEQSPTAGEPAGAEEQGAADESGSTTADPSDEAAEPAPPPSATEPASPEPAPAPAPAGDPQPTAPLTPGGPDAAATPSSETAPEASQPIVLPAAPSLPDSTKATAPDRFEATLPDAPTAPALSPVAPPTSPPDAPAATGPASDATDPAAARHAAPPPRSNLVEALGGVDRARPGALTISREIGPGAAGDDADGANPFDTIAAPAGAASAGSSLLAVLASYVIPGSGLPSTTLLLFIQLAVILAAFYAPRSGIGERIHALGRLGPRLGYRTVLARPG